MNRFEPVFANRSTNPSSSKLLAEVKTKTEWIGFEATSEKKYISQRIFVTIQWFSKYVPYKLKMIAPVDAFYLMVILSENRIDN